MVKLAMYKAKGKIGNAFIRWWTSSQYSHCELVVDGWCYSSSAQDKGVRKKLIDINDGKWDLIDLPWVDGSKVKDYFNETDENTYGWWRLVTSQLFNLGKDSKYSQFCSEWCANALGIPSASSYSPKSLYNICNWINTKE